MVHKAPVQTGAPNHPPLRESKNVTFTTNALHSIDVRGIGTADVVRALEAGQVLQVSNDLKTGNTVYTTSHFKVVAKEHNDNILVLTVINTDEIK